MRATARNFGVDHKQVQRWTELYYSLTAEKREHLKGKQTVNTGRRAFEADLEEALYAWFIEQRALHRVMDNKLLGRKAVQLQPALAELSPLA